MSDLRFWEDPNGVHVANPTEDEGTLCGRWDSEWNDLRYTKKRVVTCPLCVRILKRMNAVRFEERAVAAGEGA